MNGMNGDVTKKLVSRTVTHNKRFPLISEDLSQILW